MNEISQNSKRRAPSRNKRRDFFDQTGPDSIVVVRMTRNHKSVVRFRVWAFFNLLKEFW